MDYGYLNDQDSEGRASPILIVKDTQDKWPDSEVVPSKGTQHPYSVAVLVDIMLSHGYPKYILKSDNEPAILDLKRAASAECRAKHGHTIIFEESPVGEHQSNGFIEECVRSIKAKCRTLKFACEEMHGTKIGSEHPILPWLVRHAGACLAYGQRGPDGRTPYERLKQKEFKLKLPIFGEKVRYLKATKGSSGLEDRWNDGIFVGIVRRTQEMLIGTPDGVVKCRSLKRVAREERIDRPMFDSIRGAPWQPIPGQALMDVPVHIHVDIPAVIPHSELPPPSADVAPTRRRTYIRRDVELRKHGYSQSCPGCDAARLDKTPVAHTEACRLRIEKAMEVDERERVRITEGYLRSSANAGAPASKIAKVSPSSSRVSPSQSTGTTLVDPSSASSSHVHDPSRHSPDIDMQAPPAASGQPTKRDAETAQLDDTERMLHSIAFEDTNFVMGEISSSLHALGLDEVHISEVFCPGRFTSQASVFGLVPGTAMDLRTGWDFNLVEHRRQAEEQLKLEKPYLLVGSPKCAAFSVLQNLNPDSPQWRQTLQEGLEHLTFVCNLYKIQIRENRFFLHEHPHSAASWGLRMIREVSVMPGVIRTHGDQCPYGLLGEDESGNPALIQKRTGWLTNSPRIAEAVSKRCTNRINPPHQHHRHGHVFAWKNCRESERYPPRLVKAVLKALRAELIDRRILGALDAGATADEPEPLQLHPEWYQHVVDQSTGKHLPPELVAQARMDEMGFVRKMKIWEYDTIDNCVAATGKPPITVGWVDINKGDDDHPKVRCRLVVQETKRQTTIDPENTAAVFSATPPYEALRLIISSLMSPRTPEEQEHVLTFIDISRAHPHAPMRRDLWIKLPAEDPRAHEPNICGKLLKCLYGSRDAGQSFELLVHDFMTSRGFQVGLFTPCTFYHRDKGLTVYVYGDNFVVKGTRSQNDQFVSDLGTEMIANVEGVLGPDPSKGDSLEVVCLNKIFRWVPGTVGNPDAIEIEADPRHVDIITHTLGLTKASKAVVTPGLKDKGTAGTPLRDEDIRTFRSLTMRAAYIAEDRPDIKFATKELARWMQAPTSIAWEALKRLGRYLLGTPRLVQRFERQPFQTICVGYSDSDHAGCLRTRRSTSGTVLMHGKHMIKMLSTTQIPIALSSGESEWYAAVRTASALIGLAALARDIGIELRPKLKMDATAAKGIAARRGVGKIRHLETQTLWLQRHVTNKKIDIEKVPGNDNPSDLGTKHVDRATLIRHLQRIAFAARGGRSAIALKAALRDAEP